MSGTTRSGRMFPLAVGAPPVTGGDVGAEVRLTGGGVRVRDKRALPEGHRGTDNLMERPDSDTPRVPQSW
jgi:hypothetical protein